MSFDWPIALAALALLPILVALYIDRDRRRVASQAAFGNPDLIPNVVDRSPGRLRYLPPLTLLVALVFLIVGVARPHATVTKLAAASAAPRVVMRCIETPMACGEQSLKAAAGRLRSVPTTRGSASRVPSAHQPCS